MSLIEENPSTPNINMRVTRNGARLNQLNGKQIKKNPRGQPNTALKKRGYSQFFSTTCDLKKGSRGSEINQISLQNKNSRQKWSEEEDTQLQKLVKKFGRNWKKIGQVMFWRTGKQIRERFLNQLDDSINYEPWEPKEDQLIIKMYKELGTKWSQISKALNGRPENMVKNRFYAFLQKKNELFVDSKEPQLQENKELSKVVDGKNESDKAIETVDNFKVEEEADNVILPLRQKLQVKINEEINKTGNSELVLQVDKIVTHEVSPLKEEEKNDVGIIKEEIEVKGQEDQHDKKKLASYDLQQAQNYSYLNHMNLQMLQFQLICQWNQYISGLNLISQRK